MRKFLLGLNIDCRTVAEELPLCEMGTDSATRKRLRENLVPTLAMMQIVVLDN